MQKKHIFAAIGLIFAATICGILIAIWVFQYFKIYIPLENQHVKIDLQEPLQAEVQIHDSLDVDVSGRVNTIIPIRENLTIPVNQTLTPRVFFDNQVPIKTEIPVDEIIHVRQNMPVDTRVEIKILGKNVNLPLKGNIPIQLDIPLKLNVPLEQKIHLKFDAPIKTQLKESLRVPLEANLDLNIPIQGRLDVPIKTALKASVDVQNTLPITIRQGELVVPLNQLQLQRAQAAQQSATEHRPANDSSEVQ